MLTGGGKQRFRMTPALVRPRPLAYFMEACAKEVEVGLGHSAPRRPVNLTAGLVERCRSEVGNLSAHGEALPVMDLEKRAAAAVAERPRTERAIDASCAFCEAQGSLSEEVQSL